MKKYFVIAIAAVAALASCTKATVETPDLAISFQPANYVGSTKATTALPTFTQFGVNAWYSNSTSQNQKFMVNEVVKNKTTTWETDAVYYWPKTGTVDFQAYYPDSNEWFGIEDNTTTLTASNVTVANDTDLLYSDKAVGLNANVNEVLGTEFQGVPILFHHALAKVSVKALAQKLENTDQTVKWEIDVNSASIEKYHNVGSLTMTLSSTTATAHTKAWTLPTGEVWTPTTATTSIKDVTTKTSITATTTADAQTIVNTDDTKSFVLPQALGTAVADGQYIALNVTIRAYNKKNGVYNTTPFSTETLDYKIMLNPNANITGQTNYSYNSDNTLATGTGDNEGKFIAKMPTAGLTAWQMNKIITYYVTINPSENKITFDPAVEGMDAVEGNYTVNQ